MRTRCYTALATHSRHGLDAPGHAFVGELALVRCALPDARRDAAAIETARGRVEVEDRLLASVGEVRAFCAARGGPLPYRVEYLTAPRRHGHRFAAMSVYLLYVDPTHSGPTHFILEAGMATGEAKVCYPPCEVGVWQTVDAGYRPTPFSTARQVFRGTFDVSVDAPDEPGRLVVEAYRSPEDRTPSLRVQVAYTRDAEAAKGPHPLLSRWIAGARIGAIAGAIQAPLALALRVLLRGLGRLLPWIEAPQTARALPAPPEGRASLPA